MNRVIGDRVIGDVDRRSPDHPIADLSNADRRSPDHPIADLRSQ